eukprot:3940837-Rhodomonas_salina.7
MENAENGGTYHTQTLHRKDDANRSTQVKELLLDGGSESTVSIQSIASQGLRQIGRLPYAMSVPEIAQHTRSMMGRRMLP